MRSLSQGGAERAFAYAILIVGLAVLASMLISFPLGAAVFYSPAMTGSPLWKQYSKISLNVLGIFVTVNLPRWVNFSDAFSFLWALHAALFAMALLYPKSILEAIKDTRRHGVKALFSNTALAVSTTYPPLFLLISVLEKALEYTGIPVGQLPLYDPRADFLGLLQASVVEELGFRATLIGIVALMICLRLGGGIYSLKALWNPAATLERLGLPVSKARLNGIVIFSALVFGWAHIAYGEGVWHFGKLISATAAGIGLGYLFLFFGLPAAILVHWGFNYYYATFYFFDSIRGLPAPSELSLMSITELFEYSQEYIVVLITLQTILVISYLVMRALSPPSEKRSYT